MALKQHYPMVLLIILMHFLFSISITLNKTLLNYAPPFFAFGNKFLITGLMLLGYLLLNRRLVLQKKHLPFFFKALLFANLLPGLLRIWALQYMPPYKLAIITNLSPFFAYLFSLYIHQQQLEYKKICGIFISFFGILPLLISHAPQEDIVRAFLFFSWAEVAALIADISRSFGLFTTQKLIKEFHYSPLIINGFCMSVAGSVGILSSFLFENSSSFNSPISFYSIIGISIIISGICAHSLYVYLLKKYSIPLITLSSFSLTLFTALIGWLFLGNTITWHFYCALLGLILGLLLFCYNDLKIHYTNNAEKTI